MTDYSIISTRTLFDHPGVKIVVDTLEHSGIQRRYFYLSSPVNAVATVGLTKEGRILLTRQYRHPVRQVIYDLPAGRLNPGESPQDGARREFEEETGYFPRHIEELGIYNQFPGTLVAFTHLFFATDLVQTHQNLDEGEELEIVELTVSEVVERIVRNEFIDGSLQLGVLLALKKGLLPGD